MAKKKQVSHKPKPKQLTLEDLQDEIKRYDLNFVQYTYLAKGRNDENRFMRDLLQHSSNHNTKCVVRRATDTEDIEEHWDVLYIISLGKNKLGGAKIDVKGLKKAARKNNKPDPTIHWVELQNVNGDTGWLYGQATYIAFENETDWVLVRRERLITFIESKMKPKIYCVEPGHLYKLYKRDKRKDLLMLVKTEDLVELATALIPKNQ